ncbi:hypothetical protein ABIA33_004084 [Streptacidiphilus sp. MAP12-16]|uniref:hypothetical protein n=1 Tax=Streptacidiphilus sp. MAP12-16 TaxID=3156300 RepID=UPI003516D5BF
MDRAVGEDAEVAVLDAVDACDEVDGFPEGLGESLGHPLPLLAEVGVAAAERGEEFGGDPLLEGLGGGLPGSHDQRVEPALADQAQQRIAAFVAFPACDFAECLT